MRTNTAPWLQGVTKGARRKIVSHIRKLGDRPRMLEAINTQVIMMMMMMMMMIMMMMIMMINTQLEAEDCSLKRVLTELELLLNSPGRLGGER